MSTAQADERRVAAKVRRRLIPFLFLLYIVAHLDRINVGFAALQMNAALGFSSSTYPGPRSLRLRHAEEFSTRRPFRASKTANLTQASPQPVTSDAVARPRTHPGVRHHSDTSLTPETAKHRLSSTESCRSPKTPGRPERPCEDR